MSCYSFAAMRPCGRCGYENADHLPYCVACGRRFARGAATPVTGQMGPAGERGTGVAASVSAGYAATVAMSHLRPSAVGTELAGPPDDRGLVARALGAMTYVFHYTRGRLDAEGRRRRLVEEREGAIRQVEGALFELGQVALVDSPSMGPELAERVAAVKRTQARREAAIADLAAAEKFQAAEDLRLGLAEAAAESEWKACEAGAAETERLLRQFEAERRDDDHFHATRERAAALRASTVGSRTKLDQVIASRRQVASSMAASRAGHARDRAEAERQIRELTVEIGRAVRKGASSGSAAAGALRDRLERLEALAAERGREIILVERSLGRFDNRKLAAGVGLLAAVAVVLVLVLWVILR